MRQTTTPPSAFTDDGALSSANSLASADGAATGANSNGREKGGDKKKKKKGGRGSGEPRGIGSAKKKMMTPLVKILMFGVVLSFLDVLYIIKHLDESSTPITPAEITTPVRLDENENKYNVHKASLPKKSNNNNNNSNAASSKTKQQQKPRNDKHNKKAAIHGGVDPLADRAQIISLITDAGIEFDPVEDADLLKELPTWSEVVEIYGPEPVFYGMTEGNCERFREHSARSEHFLGTAGTFNSGTNLLSELLIKNCANMDRMKKHGSASRGIRWQVPWGKHTPPGDAEYRNTHKTKKDKLIDANEIMPMVTIRDPLIWMKSMCRHKYASRWEGFHEIDHCPNFLRRDLETKVMYSGFNRTHDSLLYLWNDYYNEYKGIDIPFLLVRFEDLLFHPEETVTRVCECAGGVRSSSRGFRYVVDTAKKGVAAHGKQRTGYVDALVKYGTKSKRYKGWDSAADLEYARDHIDTALLEGMQYAPIDPYWNTE